MDHSSIPTISDRLAGNPYPGRGIIMGLSEDGRSAVAAYFIMGRSENSRNRVFELTNGRLKTVPFDPDKVEDSSLIIYTAVHSLVRQIIVANGDHSDSIASGLLRGFRFAQSLAGRKFEPDAPHYTPRIAAIGRRGDKSGITYKMAILKAADPEGTECLREYYSYSAEPGVGHLIHTYETDGDPLPSFQGEPRPVYIPNDADTFAEEIWQALDHDNRVALYVRYKDLDSFDVTERVINRHQPDEERVS